MRSALLLAFLVPAATGQELADDVPAPPPVWEELLRLRARLEALERGRPQLAQDAWIDLSGEELPALGGGGDHVLERAWYENLRLSGYGAFAYLDTGGTGTTEHGSLLLKEASLFLDAEIWERTSLFTEVWLARYQYGSGLGLGELYLQLTGLLGDAAPSVGVKVGRFELPFGEEYLRWDATETPLVTFTAADPYGIDDGILFHGALGELHWIAAVTNGSSGSGADDGAAKLGCAKLYGAAHRDLYLSGSVLATGSTESSALRLSGSTLTPVGADGASAAGTSPSDSVESLCWELDAHLAPSRTARLLLQLGGARIDDDVDAFDRDLTWFLVEPGVRLGSDVELVLRWSEIGTYDGDEGYRFAGKIVADGESLGYDTRALRRVSAGVRWTIHPRLALKLEAGRDHIDLIDASPLQADNDERTFVAFELVGSF